MRIHLLQTNDVHSHFESYIQLATQIKNTKQQLLNQDEVVYLFDIGDHADRMRPETEGTEARVNIAMLAAMEYDAWVFGNNEGLTLFPPQWESLCELAPFPVVVSNLVQKDDGSSYPYFFDRLLFERGGVKVGVFSLTAAFNDFYHLLGAHALSPEERIPELIDRLREEGAEVIVLLSHMGIRIDRHIAEQNWGIDLIMGSHTHHVLETPEKIGRTWITGAGKYAQHFGHLVVDFDLNTRSVRNVTGGAIPRNEHLQSDDVLAKILLTYAKESERVLNQPVAFLLNEVPHAVKSESVLANLVADEMKRQTGAELAFFNTGLFNFGLEKGPVTRAQLLACCPSPINPVVVRYTGRQIKEILRKSLRSEYTDRMGIGFGFRGKQIGGIAVSLDTQVRISSQGTESDMTLSDLPVSDYDTQLIEVHINGEPLDEDRTYEAVTVDYLVFSGVYEEAAQGERVRFDTPFLRELLGRALQHPSHLIEAERKRWIYE